MGNETVKEIEKEIVYFSEFVNTLKWWDGNKWREMDEHPDPDGVEFEWVWDGKIPT